MSTSSKVVVRNTPWTSQPPSGTVVDPKWGAAFVVSPLSGGRLHDHAQNNPGTISATANLSYTKAGRSVLFPSGSCYASLPSRDAYNLLGPITLVWVGVIDTPAQYQFLIARAAGNGALNNPFEFRVNNGGGIQLLRANASGYSMWATTQSPPVGKPCVLVATHGGNLANAVGASLWINGVSYAVTPTYTTSGVATGNTEPLLLGTRGDTYSYMRGSMALAMGFPRVLKDQEIASLSANPWQIFQPQRSYDFSGGSQELTIVPGSYVTTGSNTTLLFDRTITTTGSYAVTGADGYFFRGISLNIDSATYSITGSSPSTTRTYQTTVTPSAYNITGTDPYLIQSRSVSITSGSYTTTGSAVTLTISKDMLVSPGSYTISGSTLSLIQDRISLISAGSYNTTGSTATLRYDRLSSVIAGNYNTTGSSITLLYDRKLTTTGSYSIAGSTVSTLVGKLTNITSGTYSITGFNIYPIHAYQLSSSSGSYTIVGSDVDLNGSTAPFNPAYTVFEAPAHNFMYAGLSRFMNYVPTDKSIILVRPTQQTTFASTKDATIFIRI